MPNDATRLPHLFLDEGKTRRNIADLAERVRQAGGSFRPHFKTHQSSAVAAWFRPFTSSITVSSFPMALYFHEQGWQDIMVAFPFAAGDAPLLRRLLEGGCRTGVLVDHPLQVRALQADGIDKELIDIYIELDTGNGRTGIAWDDRDALRVTRQACQDAGIWIRGLYSHFGENYRIPDPVDRWRNSQGNIDRMLASRESLGMDALRIAIGDTPSGPFIHKLRGWDSFHAGNFVFNDMQQHGLGACGLNDISLFVVAEVISMDRTSADYVVRAGSVHLSLDSFEPLDGTLEKSYGAIYRLRDGVPDLERPAGHIHRLSQEHGSVRNTGLPVAYGERVAILPAHSCLTSAMFRGYHSPDGGYLTRMEPWK